MFVRLGLARRGVGLYGMVWYSIEIEGFLSFLRSLRMDGCVLVGRFLGLSTFTAGGGKSG
jgi:hypothetical protein